MPRGLKTIYKLHTHIIYIIYNVCAKKLQYQFPVHVINVYHDKLCLWRFLYILYIFQMLNIILERILTDCIHVKLYISFFTFQTYPNSLKTVFIDFTINIYLFH